MKITITVWVLAWEDIDCYKFNADCSTAWIKENLDAVYYEHIFYADSTPGLETQALIAQGLLWINDWAADDAVTYWEMTAD